MAILLPNRQRDKASSVIWRYAIPLVGL